MMVTALQLPFQSSPLDGMSAKSQSVDSETVQSLSFGEILKAKEKQLQQQQEVSASSVAAALATLQTLSTVMPSVPEIETSANTANVDTQSGAQTNVSNLMSSQTGSLTSVDGQWQFIVNKSEITDQPVTTQTPSERVIPTELPASVSDPSQSIPPKSSESGPAGFVPVKTSQTTAPNFPTVETTASFTKDITNESKKAIARAEVTPVTLNRAASETLSNQVATQLEKPITGTKTVETQVNVAEATIETSNSTVSVNNKNETENVVAWPEDQIPINAKISNPSLPVKPALSQAETKADQPQRNAISQPVKDANFSTSDAVATELDVDGTIDQFASPSATQVELPNATQDRYSSVQTEFDQETMPFESKQVEKFADISAPTVEMPDKTPISYSSIRSETVQETIPFPSEQIENLANTNTSQIEAPDPNSVPASIAQKEIDQKTTPLASEQVEKLVNRPTFQASNTTPVQHSVDQFATDGETVTYTPQPETVLSNVVATKVKVSALDLKIPISPLASSFKETEIGAKKVVAQTLAQTEIPANPVQFTNDPSSAQTEIDQHDHFTESKTIEIKTDKPTDTVSHSQFTTGANQNSETDEAELTIQSPQSEITDSESSESIRDEDETAVPQVPVQTKASITTSVRSEGKLTPFQTETDYASLAVEKTTVEIRPDETVQSTAIQESINGVTGNSETYQAKTSEPILQAELSVSTSDSSTYQEINKVAGHAALNKEAVDASPSEVLSEIPLSNTIELSDDTAKTQPIELNDNSIATPVKNVVVNEEDNIEKPLASQKEAVLSDSNVDRKAEKQVSSPAIYPEMTDTSLVQPEPAAEPAPFVANRETIDTHTAIPATDVKVSRPAQSKEGETDSLIRNTTVTSNEAERVVSQAPHLPESHLTKEARISEEVVDNFKQAGQKDQADFPVASTSMMEDKNVNKVAISEKTGISFPANIAKHDNLAEEFATPTSTPSEPSAVNFVQTAQDLPSNSVVEPKKTMNRTSVANPTADVIHPKVELHSISKDSPVVETTDQFKDANSTESVSGFETQLSWMQAPESTDESLGLQRAEVLPSRQPIPQNDSKGFTIRSENEAKIIEAQTTVPNVQETNSVLNRSTTDTLAVPVGTEREEVAVESKMVRPQASPNTPSTEIPQTKIETHGITKDLPTIETTSHLKNAILSETTLVFDANVGEDLGPQYDQSLQAEQSFPQSNATDFNVRSGNDVEITGTQPIVSRPEETILAANQSTIDIVNDPINTEHKEVSVELEMVEPQAGTTIPSKKIPQSTVEISTIEKNALINDANTDSIKIETQTSTPVQENVIDLNQTVADELDTSIHVESEGLASEAKIINPETNTITPSAENPHSADEFSLTTNNTPNVDANTDSIEVKTQTTVIVDNASADGSVLDSMETQVEWEQQPIVEPKIKLPHVGTTTLSSEIPQSKIEVSVHVEDLPNAPTGNETPDVEMPAAGYSGKIVTSQDKSGPSMMQTEIRIEQDKAFSETKTILPQEPTGTSSSKVQKPAIAATFTTETNISSEEEEVVHQATVQQDVSQAEPLRSKDELPWTQTTVGQGEIAFETKSAERRGNASVDTLQANFGVPAETIVTNQTKAETEHLAVQPVTQGDMHEVSASENQLVKSTSETVETKNIEKRVNVDEPETVLSQDTTKPVEKAAVANDVGMEKSNVNGSFVESNERFGNVRTASANKSENITNQVPLSTTNDIEIPVSSQPSTSMKVEAGKLELKAKLAVSRDEEILPAEKQTKSSQTLESAVPATGPIKEAMTIESKGKVPGDQINAQAAELTQQVVHHMNVKLKSGPTSMHLQLNPKELGTIDVEMVSTSQGVSVTFFAEQSNTGKLLETQLNQLRESLIDSGVQLSGLNISQHGPSEQKGGFFNQDKNFTQFPQGDIPQSEPNIKETSRTERITRQSGEVDYLI